MAFHCKAEVTSLLLDRPETQSILTQLSGDEFQLVAESQDWLEHVIARNVMACYALDGKPFAFTAKGSVSEQGRLSILVTAEHTHFKRVFERDGIEDL